MGVNPVKWPRNILCFVTYCDLLFSKPYFPQTYRKCLSTLSSLDRNIVHLVYRRRKNCKPKRITMYVRILKTTRFRKFLNWIYKYKIKFHKTPYLTRKVWVFSKIVERLFDGQLEWENYLQIVFEKVSGSRERDLGKDFLWLKGSRGKTF